MGNKIVTRDGTAIDLSIPAQITSFEDNTISSHVSRAKLKVFFVGQTGDVRVFTKTFSEKLISTLPGTPVVAFYDNESEDFIGHNDEQYVYGYVPEDAVPEFVEENGKTWAVVDVNLFTERQDKIGDIANKIIGKSQSLELNPDTVDWEITYVNNKLRNIIFKSGSFYGLSVLGDKQKPAFTGSSFFTEAGLQELKTFEEQYKNDGGNNRMNKTEFLSLGTYQKIQKLEEIIRAKKVFDSFYVTDFTEEEIIVHVCTMDGCKTYAASFKWEGEDSYSIGDFYEVIPSYVRKADDSSNPSSFAKTKKEDEEILEQVGPKHDPEAQQNADNIDDAINDASQDGGDTIPAEVDDEGNSDLGNEGSNGEDSEAAEGEAANADADAGVTNASQQDFSKESDSDEKAKQSKKEDEEDKKGAECEDSTANASALSSEERDELNVLRKEKKCSLLNSYKEYLSEDVIKELNAKIDEYSYSQLETELKIKSFDANKNKLQEKGDSTHCIVLPNVEKAYGSKIDKLVAENLKR